MSGRLQPDEVEQRIRTILIQELRISATTVESITTDTPLLGKGIGIDSMEALCLATALEQEFNLQIPDEDLTVELFSQFGALSGYVVRKLQP